MTSNTQMQDVYAELAKDASESAYHCELEYHLEHLMAEMQKSQVSETEEEDDLVFA